jgi:HlyD family secretion protein
VSKKKWLLVVGVPVLVVGAVGAGLKLRRGGPQGIEVQLEPVRRMEIVQTVTATGRIQPRTQVNISADVSAKITRLAVAEGDWVEKGALLVELDGERYAAAVESAEASLRVAQANADVARENRAKSQRDFERSRNLHDEGLETTALLDAAQAQLEADKARAKAAVDQVGQVQAELKQLQDDLSKTRIHAPMEGTISQLNKEVGEIALGSQFQEDVILVISSLSGMEAEVMVDENDIVSVEIGDQATVEVDALPDMTFRGEVTEMANSATVAAAGTTDQKTEFKVKVAIVGEASRLRPGMTASADIVTDTRQDALGVPIQAVAVRTPEQLSKPGERRGPGARTPPDAPEPKWQADKDGFIELVFVVVDKTAEARQVQTGIQSETHIEIVEGLSGGEEIVVGNYRALSKDLHDGAAVVSVPKAEEPAAAGASS